VIQKKVKNGFFFMEKSYKIDPHPFEYALFFGSSPQHALDKQCGFLHKDMPKSLIFLHKRK